ncbi:MAG: hypothetical protein KDH90_09690, partial [Anaerolineae bacterium]|nr:hypothetical protein [Anaerolineae bacterium]
MSWTDRKQAFRTSRWMRPKLPNRYVMVAIANRGTGDEMRTKPTILIVFVLVMLLAAACYPPAGPSQLANPATQYC